MTSTTDDGATSRIRPALLAGEAATIARTDVHYVVTEYGIAYLFGKSIRQRATALIELAHPKFRPELFAQAQALGYLPPEQTLQNLRAYPVEEELTVTLKDGRVVMLRPAQSSDAQGIRELFHHLSEADVYTRFFRGVRGLSDVEVQRLCNLNYENEVAFVATTGSREEGADRGAVVLLHQPHDQPGRDRLHGAPRVAGLRPGQCAAGVHDEPCQTTRAARLRGRHPARQRPHAAPGSQRRHAGADATRPRLGADHDAVLKQRH